MKLTRNCLLYAFGILLAACSGGYEKVDNKWAYVSYGEGTGRRVTRIDADERSFEIIEDRMYAKDKDHVYYLAGVIPTADSKTFSVIGEGYSKDASHVFLDREIVIGADPETFRLFAFPYSRDSATIFCGTLPMEVGDIESFRVTGVPGLKTSSLSSYFIQLNPEFSFIDSAEYKMVIYGDGQAQTLTEKFESFKKTD
jgi:hypothetical protein